MNPVVLLLFFVSGATALIYEVLWSKYLALMFGSTVQAQTVVLAVFMGGLALGNRLFGKRCAKLKQPLAAYGYIELTIGLYAFFFQNIYSFADKIFVSIGSHLAENSGALLMLKGSLAIGLLLLPTVLMGGTLPLLAGWLERKIADAGRGSARFYSTNSLGAVFGSGVAGFYLVQQWGMLASLQWAAFANLAVAVGAISISRNQGDLAARLDKSASDVVLPARAALLLVTVTGGVSMGLEVLCSRAVALLVGGSLQSFAIVLMAFILGIGAGAGIVASPRFAKYQNQRTIFALMLGAATLIAIFIFGVEEWTILYTQARYAIAQNSSGYVLHQFIVAIVAILTLGLPAGLLGAVLPMAIRAGSPTGGSLGDQVGRLLTWNTVGAVIGVMITGFILMPYAGLRQSFLILAAALALIAGLGARKSGACKVSYAAYAVFASALLMLSVGSESWKSVVGAGLYRLRGVQLTHRDMQKRRESVKTHYYKDAPDATVAVEESINPEERSQLLLRINGKTDASTHGDLATQYLLGHLPMLSRPDSKDVFVLGLGSGITAGAVLGHPIESLTVAENCGPVLEASVLFEKWNRRALHDPRTHVRREDARTVLKLTDKRFDIIINEPSNPWVVGVGSVFSREFYELCASRLKDGGINAQWFHIYEMHDGIVELVFRTFASVYPYVEIWEPSSGDLILLGSMKPWFSNPDLFEKAFQRERPRLDLEEIGIKTPAAVFARQLASQRTSFAMMDEGPRQSDEFPVLEYSAPEAFFIGQSASRLFNFDERTRQCSLAAEWKRKALMELPDSVLHSVFTEYSTANTDLLNYLKWRAARGKVTPETHPVYDLDTAMPIIFRPAQSYAITIPGEASEAEANLIKAENDILVASAEAPKAPAAIAQILETEVKSPRAKRTWKPAHFAVVAARAALAKNDFERAGQLIQLGGAFDTNNVELPYLQRLLDARRERSLTAAR
jgi:spermidine synthase